MKIVYLEWKSFCNEDLYEVFEELGHEVLRVPFLGVKEKKEELLNKLQSVTANNEDLFVFSFNYFPEVSNCCKDLEVKYISWVYDSPYIHVYSYTVLNPCNYIFLFDYAVYEELSTAGVKTVYYMPLGVHDKRMKRIFPGERSGRWDNEIAFVGSLYSEQKHSLYSRFQNMDPYVNGYLEGLMRAQQHVQGTLFLQGMLSPELVRELEKAYPTDPNATTALTPEAIYAEYVLARQVTANDRKDILAMLGKRFPVTLYTHDRAVQIAGVKNLGPVDYYDEMPYVFRNTKINLNITLRSIKTGIPLRAFDILGAGGFLLTNYQAEYGEYFVPDQDLVMYSDYDDLMTKAEYYLSHEKERAEIAENGMRKVWQNHNLRNRMEMILNTVFQSGDGDTRL